MSEPEALSFEAALQELGATVDRLESGDLALEDSLAMYERGQWLARYCQTLLEQATLRVEQLTEHGEIITLSEAD